MIQPIARSLATAVTTAILVSSSANAMACGGHCEVRPTASYHAYHASPSPAYRTPSPYSRSWQKPERWAPQPPAARKPLPQVVPSEPETISKPNEVPAPVEAPAAPIAENTENRQIDLSQLADGDVIRRVNGELQVFDSQGNFVGKLVQGN